MVNECTPGFGVREWCTARFTRHMMFPSVQSVLKAQRLKFCRLDGEMTSQERARQVDVFMTDTQVQVFVLTTGVSAW